MQRRGSHLHGLLLVDKPGRQPIATFEQNIQEIPSASSQVQLSTVDSSTTNPPINQLQEIHNRPNLDGVDGSFAGLITPKPVEMPRLYTSHDVVQLVRRWSGQRRIGHTGTLDPMASGLLLLCLGRATRLVEYYQGHDKEYRAEVTLGRATDTYDAMGQTTITAAIPPLTVAQIEEILQQFRGDILQTPPIYSALKQGGESLHRKARRGEQVEVAARPITIHALELIDFLQPDRLLLRVHCSAGTYIRSLAHDLGKALGTHAHLSALRRASIGQFTIAESLSLQTVEEAAIAGQLETHLLPIGAKLAMPTLILATDLLQRLGHGQKVYLHNVDEQFDEVHPHQGCLRQDSLARAVDSQGGFCGIVRCLDGSSAEKSLWKAEKWLAGSE